MTAPIRLELIRRALTDALAPDSLDIEDQSHLHAGHAGARGGMGHFKVTIVARQFAGLKPLQQHQLVYDAVGELMQTDIHALIIDARPPA